MVRDFYPKLFVCLFVCLFVHSFIFWLFFKACNNTDLRPNMPEITTGSRVTSKITGEEITSRYTFVILCLLLTLSAHAREGYSSTFSVCLSVRITSGNLRCFSP